jgi:hypothetical protein
MMEFRIWECAEAGGEGSPPAEHSVVEVWNGRQVVATIYPTEEGICIVAPGLAAIHRSYRRGTGGHRDFAVRLIACGQLSPAMGKPTRRRLEVTP